MFYCIKIQLYDSLYFIYTYIFKIFTSIKVKVKYFIFFKEDVKFQHSLIKKLTEYSLFYF